MKNTPSTTEAVPTRSTLTFSEIMEFLEEELAKCQFDNTDDDILAPLNFDGETNRK